MAGQARGRGPGCAGPGHPGADRRDRADHLDRDLRVGPAPLRGARRRTSTPATSSATRPMGIVEEVGSEVTHIAARRPRGRAVQHLLRPLLDVLARPATPSARRPRCATRARARRSSATPRLYGSVPGGQARVPSRAPGPVRADQGARRAPDERSCTSPTSCPPPGRPSPTPTSQPGGTLAVARAGTGRASSRPGSRSQQGVERVIGVDLVPERLDAGRRARRRGARRPGRRRRRRRPHRDDRRSRPGRRHRRGRHGGARLPGARKLAQTAVGSASGRAGPAADRPVRGRPARRAAHRDQVRAPRRHRLDQRGLRRRGRPHADDGDVRPGHAAADGPVPRQAVDRRDHAAGPGRRPTRSERATWPPTCCRSNRRHTGTRCSRPRRTGASRWCSSRDALRVGSSSSPGASSGIGRATAIAAEPHGAASWCWRPGRRAPCSAAQQDCAPGMTTVVPTDVAPPPRGRRAVRRGDPGPRAGGRRGARRRRARLRALRGRAGRGLRQRACRPRSSVPPTWPDRLCGCSRLRVAAVSSSWARCSARSPRPT